jgi:hypothetical protein
MQNDKQIQDIKSKANYERASLQSINQKVSDPGLKDQITLAMALIDDVDQFFLRATKALANNELVGDHLLMAHASLEIVAKTRESLEKLLKKSSR